MSTKPNLHEGLTRKGVFLPSIHSSIVTKDYLLDVCGGVEYSLKYEDAKLRPCPYPPTRMAMLEFIRDELVKVSDKRAFSADSTHLPD